MTHNFPRFIQLVSVGQGSDHCLSDPKVLALVAARSQDGSRDSHPPTSKGADRCSQ